MTDLCLVAHLRRESPNIYDWSISPAMFDMYPALKQLIEKDFNHEDPGAESNVFSGVNGTDFMAFVKNAVHNYGERNQKQIMRLTTSDSYKFHMSTFSTARVKWTQYN